MMWIRSLLVWILCIWASLAVSQEELAGFDRTERRIVQAALALSGDYDGLIDGDFGPRSRRAFDAYMGRGAQDRSAHFAALLQDYAAEWRSFAWAAETSAANVMHFVGPTIADPGLSVTISQGDRARVQAQHDAIAGQNVGPAPYVLRRDRLLVTASALANGGRIYMRSDRSARGFDSLLLVADADHKGRLQLVASSVTRAGPQRLDPFQAPRIAALLAPKRDTPRHLAVQITPEIAVAAGSGCTAFVDADGGSVPILGKDPGMDVVALRLGATGGVLGAGSGQSPGLGVQVTVDGSQAEVVATSSALLSIGPAEILAATDVGPGQDVLRLEGPAEVGSPVLAEDGGLVGLVLRLVETDRDLLAVIAGAPVISALVPDAESASGVASAAIAQLSCG